MYMCIKYARVKEISQLTRKPSFEVAPTTLATCRPWIFSLLLLIYSFQFRSTFLWHSPIQARTATQLVFSGIFSCLTEKKHFIDRDFECLTW